MSSLTELIRGTNLNQITDKALQINTTQIKKTFTESELDKLNKCLNPYDFDISIK